MRGTDEAGCALAQSLQVDHMPYLNALQVVLDAQTDGEGVFIGVAGKDSGQCEIMLQAVQDCTAAQKHVQFYMTCLLYTSALHNQLIAHARSAQQARAGITAVEAHEGLAMTVRNLSRDGLFVHGSRH